MQHNRLCLRTLASMLLGSKHQLRCTGFMTSFSTRTPFSSTKVLVGRVSLVRTRDSGGEINVVPSDRNLQPIDSLVEGCIAAHSANDRANAHERTPRT
jgi:hypothetical protein